MSSFELWGLGKSTPAHGIDQTDASVIAQRFTTDGGERERALSMLYRKSGVRRRYSTVLETSAGPLDDRQQFYQPSENGSQGPSTCDRMLAYEAAATCLATEACASALKDARVDPASISHLVTVSCSGFAAPGFDLGLMNTLELPRSVERTHVGFMGCHGALNGLRVARALTAMSPQANVLLCALELCSLHFHYGMDPQKLVANALFADGAVGLVGAGFPAAAGGSRCRWRVVDNASWVVPDTAHMMSWRIGDHGFEMTLSPQLPELIVQQLGPWMSSWLATHNLRVSDVASWAIHPGGPRILAATAEGLGLGQSVLAPSQEILAEYGNMSSPTILFIIDRLQGLGAKLPCVALGFGPGITIEAALLA